MAKKSAIIEEYIVTIEDNDSVSVCRIYDNVKGSLRECAKSVGFDYDPTWNQRECAQKLLDSFGDGTLAEIGEYTISKDKNGNIDTYQVFGNIKEALNAVGEILSFPNDKYWNTRTYGRNIVDFAEGCYNPEAVVEINDGFEVTPDMTTYQLWETFRKEFGTILRIKKGVKRCDPTIKGVSNRETLEEMPLSEAGLKESFNIVADTTVGELEELAKQKGLKIQVATVDDWTTCLPQTLLDSAKKMPKQTTKAKMEEILNRK